MKLTINLKSVLWCVHEGLQRAEAALSWVIKLKLTMNLKSVLWCVHE